MYFTFGVKRLGCFQQRITLLETTKILPQSELHHFSSSLGIIVAVPQIWGFERAAARSNPQIWDSPTEFPRDPFFKLVVVFQTDFGYAIYEVEGLEVE